VGLVALASCTAQGARYNPTTVANPGSNGIIYVYRPKSETLWERGEPPYIDINGKNYGQLKSGGMISVTLPEGEYRVTALQTLFLVVPTIPKSITVAVVPGSRSYVRVDQRITRLDAGGSFSATQETLIEEVSAEVGQAELAKTRAN
jgi:hypothetical protein